MIILFDETDFSKPMYGSGCAAVVASAIRELGDHLIVVGSTSGEHKIGEWATVELFGKKMDFFPIMSVDELNNTKLKSERALFLVRLVKYKDKILSKGVNAAFTQSYAVMWWLAMSGNWRICFYYPGLANPLSIGRKKVLGKMLAPIYTIIQVMALRKVELAVAASSQFEIDKYNKFLLRVCVNKKVICLPTAVNIKQFSPVDKLLSRKSFHLSEKALIITFVGRLAVVKGLPLLLDAVNIIKHSGYDVCLLLVGDGEERSALEYYVNRCELTKNVFFLGNISPQKVAAAINSSDVCAVSSFVEGFSVAMIEQLACGKPIVSTNVSGASDLIKEGVNGFIVNKRDNNEFANKILMAAKLPMAANVSRQIVLDNYSEKSQWKKLADIWSALGEEHLI